MPYVTYSHAAALADLHDVELVIEAPREEHVRRANGAFRAIQVVRMPLLERAQAWSLKRIFKYNYDTQVLTAFSYPFSLAFEWCAWRQLRHRIYAGCLRCGSSTFTDVAGHSKPVRVLFA